MRRVQEVRSFLDKLGNNAVFGVVTLMLLLASVLWGAWEAWDLPLWDGAQYFATSREAAAALTFPSYQGSPAFVAYYALFHGLLPASSPFTIFFAHRIVTLILIAVLFYAFLRRLLSPGLAWLLSAFVILNQFHLTHGFVVHHFILVPLLCALLATFASQPWRRWLVVIALLATFLVRPEFILSCGVGLAALAISEWRSVRHAGATLKRRIAAIAPALLGSIPVLLTLASEAANPDDRSWMAFGDYYTIAYSQRNPHWNTSGMSDWDYAMTAWPELSARVFGDAISIPQAALTSPGAVGIHIAWNAWQFPAGLASTLSPFLRSDNGWEVNTRMGIVAAGAFIASFVAIWRQRAGLGRLLRRAPRETWIVLGACAVSPLVASLIMFSASGYLNGLLPLVMLVIGLGLAQLGDDGRPRGIPGWLVPALFLIALLVSPRPFSQPGDQRQVLPAVEGLAEVLADGQEHSVLAMSAYSYCVYTVPERCRGVEGTSIPGLIEAGDGDSFEAMLARRGIDVIMLDERLLTNVPPDGQAFIARLEADPDSLGWQLYRDTPSLRMYVRHD